VLSFGDFPFPKVNYLEPKRSAPFHLAVVARPFVSSRLAPFGANDSRISLIAAIPLAVVINYPWEERGWETLSPPSPWHESQRTFRARTRAPFPRKGYSRNVVPDDRRQDEDERRFNYSRVTFINMEIPVTSRALNTAQHGRRRYTARLYKFTLPRYSINIKHESRRVIQLLAQLRLNINLTTSTR